MWAPSPIKKLKLVLPNAPKLCYTIRMGIVYDNLTPLAPPPDGAKVPVVPAVPSPVVSDASSVVTDPVSYGRVRVSTQSTSPSPMTVTSVNGQRGDVVVHVPERTSELVNDGQDGTRPYLTRHQSLEHLATKQELASKADQAALDSAVATLSAADDSLSDRLDAVEETLPEKADLDSSGTVPVSQLPVRDIVSEALEAFGSERWPWVDWPDGPLPSAEAVLSVPYLPASAWPIALATGPDDEELVAVDGPDQLEVERVSGGGWAFLSGGRRIGCWDSSGRWESLGYWGYVSFGGSSEPPSLRRDLVVPLRPWTVTAPTRAALDWFFLDSGWDGCLVFEPTTSDGAPDGAAFAAAAVVDLPRGAAPCLVKWTGPSHWSPASRSRGSWTTRVSAPETDLVASGARAVWRVTAARRQTGDPRPSAVERVPPAAVEASPLHLPPLGGEYAAVPETVSTPVVSVDGRTGAVRLDDYAKLAVDTVAGWASDPGFVPAAGQIVVYSDGGVRSDGSVYPRIKIGDGNAYAVDLDFVGDDLADRIRANAQALSDHEADMVRHVTAAERAYWNDKVTTSSVVADGTLVVTKDNLLP